MIFVTSLNSPNLFIACLFTSAFIFSSGTDLIKSVLIGVGPTTLTVMLRGANSLAKIFVKLTTAAFEEA